jgi:F-type H+-transporting ATPase subunit epsilon
MVRIPLSIITPDKVTWEGEVDSLILPAYEGQMGILPGHAPLFAQLTPGVVQIRAGDDTRLLSVSGGFVEVFNGRVSLFAETAELAEEIDSERAKQAAEKARAALKKREGALDPEQALASLQKAMARLRVAELSRLRRGSSQ